MSFRVPAMPLTAAVWYYGSTFSDPPDFTTPANLTCGRRVVVASPLLPVPIGITHNAFLGMVVELMVPKLTDLRPGNLFVNDTTLVECPAGSGRYYVTQDCDDVAKGFVNEYRLALLLQLSAPLAAYYGIGAWGGPPTFQLDT
jgi:hypothetical protein